MGLNLTLTTTLEGDYTGGSSVAPVDAEFAVKQSVGYVTGSGAGQADLVYSEAIDIAASGTATIDLASLTDELGASVVFARVKAIVITADAGNTNDIVLSGGASDPFVGPLAGTTPSVATRPGGMTILADAGATGWAVASGSVCNIKLANSSSGTAVTGKLVVIGAAE